MSHIPSSAMPHAGHIETPEEQEDGDTATLTERASERASGFADKMRANPKPAIAAGAAILAGAVAAAAIPFIGRNWVGGDAKKSAAAKKSSAKKSAAGKEGAAKTNSKAKSTAKPKAAAKPKSAAKKA